jgi:tetratricopeptide (TPR) repeat protein
MKLKLLSISALLIIQVFLINTYSQDTRDEKFRQGADYYTAGAYEKALEQWIDLYNTGYRSADLEYNIGNAYFKINNVPGAILFYERAHLHRPADEDINYNLQIARTLAVDSFEDIPEIFLIKWYNFLALLQTTNNWAKTSLVSFIFCLLLLSLYFYSSKYKMKVIGFWLALLLMVISLTSLAFSFRNRALVLNNRDAIIFSPLVNGKSSPDDSGTDLFVLHEGTKVTVEDEVGEWYEIRLSDGNKGWIPSNSLEKI